jgi:hypothetical protein
VLHTKDSLISKQQICIPVSSGGRIARFPSPSGKAMLIREGYPVIFT